MRNTQRVIVAAALILTFGAAGSSASTVASAPNSLTFAVVGHGFGHGRGLSQWGARGAAEADVSLRKILSFYYPGTRYARLRGGAGVIRIVLTNAGAEGVAVLTDPRRFQCDFAAPARSRDNCGFTAVAQRGLVVRDVMRGPQSETLPNVVAGKPVQLWGIALAGARGLRVAARTADGWRVVGPQRSVQVEFGNADSGSVQVRYQNGTVRDYRGVVRILRTGTTTIARVNVVGVDDYLRGVVPREMPSLWPATALRAQAVAARSYSMSRRDTAKGVGALWDLCDSQWCQVYGGRGIRYADGRGESLEAPGADAAIRATANRVLSSAGRVVFAQFSASNGGWTARGSVSYQQARRDPWDAAGGKNPHSSWSAQVPAAAWQGLLPAGYRLTRVVVTRRDGIGEWGGRVERARLDGTTASGGTASREVTGVELYRAWPGVGKLRSTWFQMVPQPAPRR